MSSLIEAVALHGGRVPLQAGRRVGAGGDRHRRQRRLARPRGPADPARRGGLLLARRSAGLPPYRLKILVGCGAAAGFAAAYNVPIGGSLFAMEVILGNFALEIFGPIVVAAVVSTLIARAAESNTPLYAAPGYALESPWEILAYVGLGLVGAIASLAFVLGVRWTSAALPSAELPAAAGRGRCSAWRCSALSALVGAAGPRQRLRRPSTRRSPGSSASATLLLLLPLAKLVATALTIGSGGAGGLFTPSLFFGALVGGAYG